MLEASTFEYSPTPRLSVSPATMDAFVDHMSDPNALSSKENTAVVVPALAHAYAGEDEGGIPHAWTGFAWNATGPGISWV
jgi:hypothetical protein